MNSDIYLFLLRQEGKFESFAGDWKTKGKATLLSLPKWLKGMVMGDSLDAPFIKFIKVASVSHSISFGDGAEKPGWGDDSISNSGTWQSQHIYEGHGGHNADYIARDLGKAAFRQGWKTVDRNRGRSTSRRENFETGNTFLTNHLPEHGTVSFTKGIDKATPQLAFGCSAQERFPFGVFFYRRRTGLGIEGSRMPYLVIGVDKVLISGWEIDGDAEKVTLRYKRIAWAATDQISDTNVSIPGFARTWDVESRTGGEGGWALGLQALALALAGMTGLLAKPFSS